MSTYFIFVDGEGYQGEDPENVYPTNVGGEGWHIHNHNELNILLFGNSPKAIVGVINLKSELDRIFKRVRDGKLIIKEIIIKCQDGLCDWELSAFRGSVQSEMKKQLDIATDLGEQRFRRIKELEKEIEDLKKVNKELAFDKETLMNYELGNMSLRLCVLDLLSKCHVICDVCGGSGGVEVGENEVDTCPKCDGHGLVSINQQNEDLKF